MKINLAVEFRVNKSNLLKSNPRFILKIYFFRFFHYNQGDNALKTQVVKEGERELD